MELDNINEVCYRKVLGQRLKDFRESRGITLYAVAKKGNIRHDQASGVETGARNYSIEAFLGYLRGCGLRMTLQESSDNNDMIDIAELILNSLDEQP